MPNILVVEDEKIVAKDLENILVQQGYGVTGLAATSDEAIRSASSVCPDLVLMDIRIRGELDGIATAEILRSRFGLPIVYLTAHADADTLARARSTEPYGYVIKPFSDRDIRSAVEIALYKHEMDMRHVERERWLSTTLTAIGDPVITCDDAERITFMNPAAESLTGWRRETALGHGLAEVLQQLAQSHRAIDHTAAPIYGTTDGAGTAAGAVMVFRDLTDELAQGDRAAVGERLASLATMAGGLAHEVQNPLAINVANLSHALSELRKLRNAITGEPAERLARIIESLGAAQEGAEQVRRVVTDLRTFSRTQPTLQRRVEVKSCLEWAIAVTSSTLRQRAQLRQELGDVPSVAATEVRLSQVFVNLLLNAAQAIAPGDPAGNEIRVSLRGDEQGRVVIEIGDTGAGMTADVQRRVFDPFFTTKPGGAGSGLGLSTCYGIVRSTGGEISVRSEPGHGSVFTVRLPPGPTAAVAPLPDEVATTEVRGRILVIDDDERFRESIRRLLEREHEVELAPSSRHALSLICGATPFDAVLCDMALTQTSVTELYESVLRTMPDRARQMIFVGSSGFLPESEDFLASVPNRHLEKPFGREELLRILQEMVRRPS